MSVVVLDENEIWGIQKAIMQLIGPSFLEWHEDKNMPVQDLNMKIACWADRLHIANQMAYKYSYWNDDADQLIRRLDTNNTKSAELIFDKKVLYSKLCNLKYHLYSNCGNMFCSAKDFEKLDRMLSLLAHRIIREAE
jgi:hypothetical protein